MTPIKWFKKKTDNYKKDKEFKTALNNLNTEVQRFKQDVKKHTFGGYETADKLIQQIDTLIKKYQPEITTNQIKKLKLIKNNLKKYKSFAKMYFKVKTKVEQKFKNKK